MVEEEVGHRQLGYVPVVGQEVVHGIGRGQADPPADPRVGARPTTAQAEGPEREQYRQERAEPRPHGDDRQVAHQRDRDGVRWMGDGQAEHDRRQEDGRGQDQQDRQVLEEQDAPCGVAGPERGGRPFGVEAELVAVEGAGEHPTGQRGGEPADPDIVGVVVPRGQHHRRDTDGQVEGDLGDPPESLRERPADLVDDVAHQAQPRLERDDTGRGGRCRCHGVSGRVGGGAVDEGHTGTSAGSRPNTSVDVGTARSRSCPGRDSNPHTLSDSGF